MDVPSEESSLAGDVFVVAMFRRPAAGDPGGPPGLRPSLPALASGPTGQGSGHQRASTARASSESQVATCLLASGYKWRVPRTRSSSSMTCSNGSGRHLTYTERVIIKETAQQRLRGSDVQCEREGRGVWGECVRRGSRGQRVGKGLGASACGGAHTPRPLRGSILPCPWSPA